LLFDSRCSYLETETEKIPSVSSTPRRTAEIMENTGLRTCNFMCDVAINVRDGNFEEITAIKNLQFITSCLALRYSRPIEEWGCEIWNHCLYLLSAKCIIIKLTDVR